MPKKVATPWVLEIINFESYLSYADYLLLFQSYQNYLDKWTPYTISRWVFSILLIVAFIARIVLKQGWFIICYALGIYHLNLFLAFLTPKIDPAYSQDDGPGLPTKSNEEFRPFMRRLPEFKFWYSVTKSTVIACGCTFFQLFNVPVFWPILVMYFITLFCITMKRQIKVWTFLFKNYLGY
ncbi:UNVERIFIED_CONTAM: hypothetical protein GTU68_025786 [Idotea baltica]|nr:hypothetical protein [Idotea baltica]